MKTKKCLCVVLMLALVLTLIPSPAYASTNPTSAGSLSAGEIDESNHFIPMTREEYIQAKAERNGISYAEAEAQLEQSIFAYESTQIAPCSWEGDYTEYKGNSTYYTYGLVYCIYTHESGLKMRYSVQAVRAQSHYGSGWVDCNSVGSAYAYGDGGYTFEGTCTASLISSTQLRMACDGFFEIPISYAASMGISGFLIASGAITTTTYYRLNIYTTHVETYP